MPHALLLSPDDQAVNAITGVLEEMSVTCERPLDGVTAAKKLNSQSFDLVLVDCENLPAAKLIFDVCRRGKGGNNPVPIAIVDGRAGLPTAFRLGAELILTKPVAKDQARTTIRTAVSRVRKDFPANEIPPVQAANITAPPDLSTSSSLSSSSFAAPLEERAHAAAVSSQLTSYADDPAPQFMATAASSNTFSSTSAATDMPATLSATDLMTTLSAATDEIEAEHATPAWTPQFAVSTPYTPEPETPSTQSDSVNAKLARIIKPSDDPVLAEIDRTEQEQADLAEAKAAEAKLAGSNSEDATVAGSSSLESSPASSRAAGSLSDQSALDKSATQISERSKSVPKKLNTKSFENEPPFAPSPRSGRGPLVAVLMLAVAGGGFYAAWEYQPGFRDIAKPQIDRLLGRTVTTSQAQTNAPAEAAPEKANEPAAQAQANPNQMTATPPNPEAASSSAVTPAPVAANAPADGAAKQPAPGAPATTVPSPFSNKIETAKAGDGKSGQPTGDVKAAINNAAKPEAKAEAKAEAKVETKNDVKPEVKKDLVTATPSPGISSGVSSGALLPGESTAVILSSKGAEKRLAHSVPPQYPTDLKSADAQATVVLKTVVGENGEVQGVRLVDGNAVLANAAMQAVKQWRYRPYIRDGKALPFQTVVIIDFQRP